MVAGPQGGDDEHRPRPELNEDRIARGGQWKRQQLRDMREDGSHLHSGKHNRPQPVRPKRDGGQSRRKRDVDQWQADGEPNETVPAKGDGE